jgi:hypothetical protein
VQLVEVAAVVEIQIQHRPIMLARSDEHRRLAAEEEIMGVVGT